MPDISYRCLKLPTQPIMNRKQCIARGLKPKLFDQCVSCMYTIQRKAITNTNQNRREDCNQIHPHI